jgi:hypothetical protein
LAGGVGGTGEPLREPFIDGHNAEDGISSVRDRFRLPVEVTEFRVIGVIKLDGRVSGEKHESLISVSLSSILSSSEASYMSSYPLKSSIWDCHSVSEHDEVVPAERGDIRRARRACVGIDKPLVCNFNCGLIAAGVSLEGAEPFGLV